MRDEDSDEATAGAPLLRLPWWARAIGLGCLVAAVLLVWLMFARAEPPDVSDVAIVLLGLGALLLFPWDRFEFTRLKVGSLEFERAVSDQEKLRAKLEQRVAELERHLADLAMEGSLDNLKSGRDDLLFDSGNEAIGNGDELGAEDDEAGVPAGEPAPAPPPGARPLPSLGPEAGSEPRAASPPTANARSWAEAYRRGEALQRERMRDMLAVMERRKGRFMNITRIRSYAEADGRAALIGLKIPTLREVATRLVAQGKLEVKISGRTGRRLYRWKASEESTDD